MDTSISSAIENQNVAGFTEDGGSSSLTPEEEQKFLNLSRRPDLYDLLSRSLGKVE